MSQSDVRLYLGKRGTGKSYRASRDLREHARVIVYDTLIEGHYDRFRRLKSFPELLDHIDRNPDYFRIAYHDMSAAIPMGEDFDRCCKAVYCAQDVVFLVEEVSSFCSPTAMPLPLENLVNLGRHRDISLWCTSRRPKQVHALIRSQANRVESFCQTEPGDLAWLSEVMGERAYTEIPQLPQYRSIVWTDGYEIRSTRKSSLLTSSPEPS